MPRRIIVVVLIMLRTSFCAVPAFMRVDPVTISGPTRVSITTSATFAMGESGAATIAAVRAFLDFAYSRAAIVYGVLPLAAMPTTRSFEETFFDFRSAASLQAAR